MKKLFFGFALILFLNVKANAFPIPALFVGSLVSESISIEESYNTSNSRTKKSGFKNFYKKIDDIIDSGFDVIKKLYSEYSDYYGYVDDY